MNNTNKTPQENYTINIEEYKPQKLQKILQKLYNLWLLAFLPKYRCPYCKSPLFKIHGVYHRHVYLDKERAVIIDVTRVQCKSCKRTKILLHPLILPHKRYCASFVLNTILLAKKSINHASETTGLWRNHIRYYLRQFHAWHKLGVETLKISLPPPDVMEFLTQYIKKFGYCFMEKCADYFHMDHFI